MVDAKNGVPAILVASVVRTIAYPSGHGQSTVPAGVMAQWIAVKRDI
ncbi:MAG: hypothetical protein ACRER2_16970 [Methylococcales bacterium]